MAEQSMEAVLRMALWRQFGAAIDMLENAVMACPASLWQEHLWDASLPPEFPPHFAEFWSIAFHLSRPACHPKRGARLGWASAGGSWKLT